MDINEGWSTCLSCGEMIPFDKLCECGKGGEVVGREGVSMLSQPCESPSRFVTPETHTPKLYDVEGIFISPVVMSAWIEVVLVEAPFRVCWKPAVHDDDYCSKAETTFAGAVVELPRDGQ